MTDVSIAPTDAERGTSILVFGSGESPMSILAAALARQAQTHFGWAHCSATTQGMEATALHLLESNSEPRGPSEVQPRDMASPPPFGAHLDRLVVSETIPTAERSRLTDYLRLPVLLQRFLSNARAPDGPAMLVLTNADALPPSVTEEGLGRSEMHQVLRRERASLIVTYRGIPPAGLSRAFERVYRIESAPGSQWGDAVVTRERGIEPGGMPSPATLSELLPWLGLAQVPFGGPGPGHGHYLP
ncbi:MAG: hypothetical protein WB809_04130 [Thermoplasmata archaeon]